MKNKYYHPLHVSLTHSRITCFYKPNAKLKAHKSVIKILLKNCIEAFVFGLKEQDELYIQNSNILINDRGKFRFDLSKDCVKGHEYLWNATGWKRGSIVIVLKRDAVNFKALFKDCYRPGLSETPNSGNTPAATKKCREESKMGNIGICLSASNGMEWMNIYAEKILTNKLFKQAEKYCKETDYWRKEMARLGIDD
jgi:hypothetical protein